MMKLTKRLLVKTATSNDFSADELSNFKKMPSHAMNTIRPTPRPIFLIDCMFQKNVV